LNTRESKQKASHSVLSNTLWSFRTSLSCAPGAFWMAAAMVPLNSIISFWQVYVPALVVAESTSGKGYEQVLITMGIWFALILAASLVRDIITRFNENEWQKYAMHMAMRIRRKSMSCFYEQYERKEVRDLCDRALITTQSWNGRQPVTDLQKQSLLLIENLIGYLLMGGIISVADFRLLPIVMLGPVVNLFAVRAFNRWSQKHHERYREISRRLSYVLRKPMDFAAAKDIRIYSMHDWFSDTCRLFMGQIDKGEREKVRRQFGVSFLALAMILLRDGVSYAFLIALTLRGGISVDQFVLCFGAISSFSSFFGSILDAFGKLHETSLRICDLREYLDLPEMTERGHESIEAHLASAPEITFDHVSYRYAGAEEDTIRDLSLTIHAGESVALVGLNGAGKTTLVKLMCGLYRPTSGEIRLNGIPADQFQLQDYYRMFSPVFQDAQTAFFSIGGTVSAKVSGGYDEARVLRCLEAAGLGEKVKSLPNGIHTMLDKQLNENAVELSGGEVQKLMLARALYKDAPFLVLDEPTAALDPIAENAVYQEYRRMTHGKSALFISHRLASTRFCDRIIYLKNGVITETGSHDELIAAGGEYAELYELQSCWYRDDYRKEDDDHDIS